MGIPENAPLGTEEALWRDERRHYIPWWLPEALAEMTAILYGLGGVKEDPEKIVDRWMGKESERNLDSLISWMDTQGAETKTDGG